MKYTYWLGLLAVAASFSACSRSQSDTTLQTGTYRAVIQSADGALPFGLAVESISGSQNYRVFALNGAERLPMDTATVQGDSLHIPMRLFDSELIAKIDGKTLRGVWRRTRIGLPSQSLPFEATHGDTYRFVPDSAQARTRVAGRWATQFDSKTGRVDTVNAVGVFEQKGNHVTGTFLTPTGDYRYLDGNVVGDSLFLSCFDGSHVYLFKARYDANTQTLTGGHWAGIAGYYSWVAKQNPNAQLPDPATLTYLKPGAKTLHFSFPEPDGHKISLQDSRFKGNVTVVQIMGSWCPNCMDETNFLSPWYKKNHGRGVEMLGLSFERSADMAVAGPKIEQMKKRFQIDYPVVLAGSTEEGKPDAALPELNRVMSFPTTLFVDKKGNVRHIHTGFNGPGTGPLYDQYVAEFNRLIDKLLAE